MSAFDSVDPHASRDRRKQLLQKLMQQAQATKGVAMPGGPRTALGMSEGRSFRNATDLRHGGALPITQGSNILPNVLAKLGIVGRTLASEVSPGQGMAIDVPHPEHVARGLDVNPGPPGPPVPTGPPAGTPPGPVNSPVAPPPATDMTPTPDFDPSGGGNVGTHLIPLGNGQYYDPIADTVRGIAHGTTGTAARGL